MVIRLHARSSRIVVPGLLIFGFALASWIALRPWIAQRALNEESLEKTTRHALAIDPGNDRLYAILGAIYQYDLFLRNYPAALTSYQKALTFNPLDRLSWLHLGKLHAELEQIRESDHAFTQAARVAPSDSSLLWEIATARLDEGQVAETISTLTEFLAASPLGVAVKGYELARRLVSPEEVLEQMIAPDIEHYTHYAHYLLDRNLGDQAFAVWNRINDTATRTGESIDPSLQLRIVDLLMATGKLDQAHQLWTTLMAQTGPDAAPTASNLVSNGNFERRDTIGRGFDWRIGGASGVVWAFDPDMAYAGRRSLRLSFTKSRADFSNVSQMIPVQPYSSYALQARIRTDGLAGSKGVAFEVLDSTGAVMAGTDPVGGTRDWTLVTASFRTAGNARVITFRIHSEPPPPYLPPLFGSVWIDDISLTKVE